MEKELKRLKDIDSEIILLTHMSSILGWDQETYMPPKGITERGGQLALLEGIMHQKGTSDEIGECFSRLGVSESNPKGDPSLNPLDRAFLRSFYREYSRKTKLPERLVTETAKHVSIAQASWIEARKKSDFSIFSPNLEILLDLTKEKAECIGYKDHIYDALIDEFEPWARTTDVKKVFDDLKVKLVDLAAEIKGAQQVDDSFLQKEYPVDKQDRFGRMVIKDMGYDMERGRLDISAHPFTSTLGKDDIRLTTRYNKDFFKTGIFGNIHECGHGLYELGFNEKLKGSILASAPSLGFHESQSRTWENIIGRSSSFWMFYYPKLKDLFPDILSDVTADSFYRGVNKVEPSMIRVEADEVTYSLHIILRFELETALLSGDLQIKDLPAAWNSKMKELLDIVPDNDAEGVLQDIHWAMGAFGYFPTYALGNLYGAQFYSKMREDIPDLDKVISEGKLLTVLEWLRGNIHDSGSEFTAFELCKKVTGRELDPGYFTRYLTDKYSRIYDL